MLPIFLALAIVGIGLLALQSLGGHDAEAEIDDLELDGEVDGHDADHDSLIFPWASLRFWAVSCAASGSIGTLGLWLTDAPRALVASVAVATGVILGWLSHYVLVRLARDASSSTASLHSGRGRLARVVTPIGEGTRGKIRLEIKGQLVDMVARAELPIEAGAEVVVTDIEGEEAQVIRAPRDLAG